ncbi:MAG: aminotransferase class IV [Deltaproteobacteria bacterium]
MRHVRPPRPNAGFAWVDGTILPAARASVPVFDRGFLYGEAFFETLLVRDGRPLLWRPHLKRLHASLAHFAIPRPEHDLGSAAADLLAACRLRDAALRITVTRGTGEGLAAPEGTRPTVVMTLRPLPPGLDENRVRGITAVRLAFGQGLARPAAGHKNVDYLAAIAGRRAAVCDGASDAIFVEADGRVSEATTSNLFMVRRGRLATPPDAAGCLPGVTRDVVLVLARRAGLDVREAPIAAAALDRADEILLTSSIAEVVPVVVLDGRPVGSGRPGPVALRLQELYRAFLARSLTATTTRGRRRPSTTGPHPPSRRGAWRSQARLARGRP